MHRNEYIGQLFAVGKDILVTTLNAATKVILAQLGDSTASVADSDAAEWWQHIGFASRPAKPTQGTASCQGIILQQGDRDIVMATRDTRGTTIYGNLKDGEACMYAPGAQGRILFKADGSVTRYTTSDNTAGGTSISDRLGPDGWTLTLPWGEISFTAAGVSISVDGAAAITLSPEGIAKVLGTQVAVHGTVAAICGDILTTVGPMPLPTPGTPGPNSAIAGPAGITGLPSVNVFISLT